MFSEGLMFSLFCCSLPSGNRLSKNTEQIAPPFRTAGEFSVPKRLLYCTDSLKQAIVRICLSVLLPVMSSSVLVVSCITVTLLPLPLFAGLNKRILLPLLTDSRSFFSFEVTEIPLFLERLINALRSASLPDSRMNNKVLARVDFDRCMLWSSFITISCGLRLQCRTMSCACEQLTTESFRE